MVAINNRCTISIAPDDRSYVQSWRPIVLSIVTAGDRWYDQSLHPATDRTSNRGILHDISTDQCGILCLVASCDRVYDRGTRRSIVDQSWGATIVCTINRSIVRPIVATYDRSYDQSWHQTTDRTINRSIVRPIVRSIRATTDPRSSTTGGATMHDWWYDRVRPICDRLRFGSAG